MNLAVTTHGGRRVTGLLAMVLVAAAVPVSADIYVYYNIFGQTIQLGTVPTTTGFVETADGTEHHTDESPVFKEESHMAIVCHSGGCGIVGDCRACHVTPKRASTFTRRVADLHRRTHFVRGTMPVGTAPVAFDGGFVQMQSGRLVLLDRDQTPRYRLPTGARLLKDTRTGQALFVVYDGRMAPEPIRR